VASTQAIEPTIHRRWRRVLSCTHQPAVLAV